MHQFRLNSCFFLYSLMLGNKWKEYLIYTRQSVNEARFQTLMKMFLKYVFILFYYVYDYMPLSASNFLTLFF